MNRKNLPLLLMLTAGVIMCIISYVQKFSILAKLVSLFVVLLAIYLAGSVLVWILNYFDRQNEERLKEEGEVIEKDNESAETEKKGEGDRSGKKKDEVNLSEEKQNEEI